MRMHGFSLMSIILTDYAEDRDIILKVGVFGVMLTPGIGEHEAVAVDDTQQDRGLQH